MDLIAIFNPGWPVVFKGRTYRLSPLGPFARSRLNQILRAHYLAQAKKRGEGESTIHERIRAGKADMDSLWADQFMGTDLLTADGLLALITAMLSTHHPDIAEDDVCRMVMNPSTRASLMDAVQFSRPRKDGSRSDCVDWREVIGTLMKLRPGWTFDDIRPLSDEQINLIFDEARDQARDAGTTTYEGEWTQDEVLGK